MKKKRSWEAAPIDTIIIVIVIIIIVHLQLVCLDLRHLHLRRGQGEREVVVEIEALILLHLLRWWLLLQLLPNFFFPFSFYFLLLFFIFFHNTWKASQRSLAIFVNAHSLGSMSMIRMRPQHYHISRKENVSWIYEVSWRKCRFYLNPAFISVWRCSGRYLLLKIRLNNETNSMCILLWVFH